ncbi:LysR family transcriptional regulator [Methylobacterium platani]|uniref:LysR family transcriptional regulator n=1 Tax=Methylobacterium platani TaxID=427683 RepID=A0A179SDY2_9HYPH|nr:LysR family transcriptional regulator [Methylobacterium platani]OAS26064.1 LysR family transcriptional regulator [Methylobacterium platani]
MTAALAWDDFRLVKAISDQRGLTLAAERLGINHSTAFRRLGQIEAALRTPLFERHRTGYVPTPAAEEMARIAARMEEDVLAFTRRIESQGLSPAGELRVTTAASLLTGLLTPILAEFCARCPEVRLDVVVSEQALNLAKGDADVALRATNDPPDTLVGRRLATIAWALYGRADRDDDARQRWVSPAPRLGAAAAARYVQERTEPERVVLRLDTVQGLADAVEAGIGIGPLPCVIGDRRPGLMRLSGSEPELDAGLWLLTHPDLRRAARVRAFLDFVGAAIARERDLIEGRAPSRRRDSPPHPPPQRTETISTS